MATQPVTPLTLCHYGCRLWQAIEVQLEQQVNESSALRENVQNTITALQTECTQLTSGFNQFKQWVNKKMRDMQEEMDICKVIYTLHGSLSKVSV